MFTPQESADRRLSVKRCNRNSQLVKLLGIMKCGVLDLKLDIYKSPSEVQGIYERCEKKESKRQEGS